MRDKYKIIGAILVVIIVFVITRACSNYFSNKIREDVKSDTQIKTSNEFKSEYAKDWIVSICDFLNGNIEYDQFPLSNNFKIKYKSVKDIIQGKVMGTIEANSDIFDINADYDKQIMGVGVKTGKGYEEVIYQLHYIINDKNELDDIEILDSRVVIDENGGYPKYVSYKTYDKKPSAAIYCLTNPKRYMHDGDICYLTENYIEKHKDYMTNSILPWKDWLYIDEFTVIMDKSDNRIWYLEAVNMDEVRKYKIKFIIDDRGYVDDYIIDEIERREVLDKESVKSDYYEFYS